MALEQLLAERAALSRRIAEIDVALSALGVEAIAVRPGGVRSVALVLLAALVDGPRTSKQIAEATRKTRGSVDTMLGKLVKRGEVVRVGCGVYALPGGVGRKGARS